MPSPGRLARASVSSILLCAALSACGGGGGSGGDVANEVLNAPPVANAGADFAVEERGTASLDGSSSRDADGTVASWSWRQVSGQAVQLLDANQALARFDVPEVAPAGAELVFELTVRDDDGAAATDGVTVTVTNVNLPPLANAGPDRSEPERTQISLDASASSDPDVGIRSYLWTQVSGTPVAVSNADGAVAFVTTPEVSPANETLVFEVTVTDTDGASATDRAQIEVFNVNLPPSAEAGADASVYEGKTFVLDGTGSTDQDGAIAAYAWRLLSGIAIDLPDPAQAQVSMTAPATTQAFQNVYELTVTDELGDSSTDTVNVTIRPIIPPVADAGPDQTVESEARVVISAAASSDADGEITAFRWLQTEGPAVDIGDPAQPELTFTAPLVGDFTVLGFELTVVDDSETSSTDSVAITVTPPTFDLSGVITVPEGTLVDSDVNDPAADYAPNDAPDIAQLLPNPVTLGGYANRPFQGENGRSWNSGDISDFFRVVLSAGQPVVAVLGDAAAGDLDLYLWDASGTNILDASLSTSAREEVVAPADGEYVVEIYTFSGASNYVLAVEAVATGQAVPGASGFSLHSDFVPGEAIVKRTRPAAAAGGLSRSLAGATGASRLAGAPARAMLYRVAPILPEVAALAGIEHSALDKRSASLRSAELRAKWETLLALKVLAADPDTAYAEPNYILRPHFEPNDEHYERQWHYPLINLPAAWDLTLGVASVTVAVIDTGVLLSHPDLQGRLTAGYDFISSTSISNDGDGIDPDPDDPGDGCGSGASSFHGTHVAGTVGAATNNVSGVAGVAGGVTIMPLRALGCGGGFTYDIAQAVLFAAGLINDSGTVPDTPADVINLSLGGPSFSQFAQDTFNAARNAGLMVVASAGNSATSQPSYPAAYDGVISVSAVGADGTRAVYSNFGDTVDVAAPGGAPTADSNNDGFPDSVYSTDGEETAEGPIEFVYEYKMGTSMAAPHVAGVLALMRSVNGDLTPDDIDTMLIRNDIVTDIGSVGRDPLYGWGLIDARKAVDAAIAAVGDPPAGNPAMVVQPRLVHFGAFSATSSFDVSNAAGGELVVGAITPDPGATWLAISPSETDANGVGTYTVSADRTGLSPGTYDAAVTIESNANTVQLQATMLVAPAPDGRASAGQLYVVLVDAAAQQSVYSAPVVRDGEILRFTVTNILEGTYEVVAGSDADNDFFICDGAEACGEYPEFGSPAQVVIDADTTGIDFAVGYDRLLPAGQSGQDSGKARLSK
jgi:serine protease